MRKSALGLVGAVIQRVPVADAVLLAIRGHDPYLREPSVVGLAGWRWRAERRQLRWRFGYGLLGEEAVLGSRCAAPSRSGSGAIPAEGRPAAVPESTAGGPSAGRGGAGSRHAT